jgi:hypothetical protein
MPVVEPAFWGSAPEAASDVAQAALRLRVAAGAYGGGGGGGVASVRRVGFEDEVDFLRRQLAALREQLASQTQRGRDGGGDGGDRATSSSSSARPAWAAPALDAAATPALGYGDVGAAFVARQSGQVGGGEDFRALSSEQQEAMERAAGPFADDDDNDDSGDHSSGGGGGGGSGWRGFGAASSGAVSTVVELDLLGARTRGRWLAPPASLRGPFHPANTGPLPPRFQPPPRPLPARSTGAAAAADAANEEDLGLREHAVGASKLNPRFKKNLDP